MKKQSLELREAELSEASYLWLFSKLKQDHFFNYLHHQTKFQTKLDIRTLLQPQIFEGGVVLVYIPTAVSYFLECPHTLRVPWNTMPIPLPGTVWYIFLTSCGGGRGAGGERFDFYYEPTRIYKSESKQISHFTEMRKCSATF